MNVLFSHEMVRDGQRELMQAVVGALKSRKHVLAHAPTGLGKTAAVLCPALAYAQKHDLTVLFLTSRHTHHRIVLETLKLIKKKHGLYSMVTSIVGKQNMCALPNVGAMPGFAEYCKSLIGSDACDFYKNARSGDAKIMLSELRVRSPVSADKVISACRDKVLCPYEMSLIAAQESRVIVADYFYVFHPGIRETFFSKIKKSLDRCILIIDEAHNLPSRVRDMLTSRLSGRIVRLAFDEAGKAGLDVGSSLAEIREILGGLGKKLSAGGERLVSKDEFVSAVSRIKDYEHLVAELKLAADVVRDEKRVSHIGSVADFLEEWRDSGECFARFAAMNRDIVLSSRCLDPSIVTKKVIEYSFATIMMSGTLSPLVMYRDVLGFPDNTIARAFESPFPERNRLTLVVPRTTTKFSRRSEQQFNDIGRTCADIANSIPGCTMIFFPSYSVRDAARPFFVEEYSKTVFLEGRGMSKFQRQELLERFAKYKDSGAALLCVASGSFGEGVDLPGVLKGVIVAGLPLDRPDLETTELIQHYDRKFGKGWEYGYILPAMTRCIQNAGRCIRSETDRGAIIFLDERYVWPRYKNCFPPEWDVKVGLDYSDLISSFFS